MAAQTSTRIWQWAAILLLLCNIGLILTIWLKPGRQDHGRRETPRDFVIRNLQFTDKQVADYDLLIKDHRAAMNRLHKDNMGYRQTLFATLSGKTTTNADSLGQLIAKNQQDIELVTYKHFMQVRTLCTDEQKAKFDEIIGEVIKKMNGHGGPPPPPDGHGPPPDGQGPPPDGEGPPEGRDGPPPPDEH
ncbi:MAG: hypothetical protein JWQ38_1110 [Flavipsychrobacter sp.]|nr:hypothetical protein [Flavipsychrobacter sp.]